MYTLIYMTKTRFILVHNCQESFLDLQSFLSFDLLNRSISLILLVKTSFSVTGIRTQVGSMVNCL